MEDNNDLSNRFNILIDENRALLSATAYEKQILQEEIGARDYELDHRSYDYQEREAELDQMETSLTQMKGSLDERERKLAEMEALVNAKDFQIDQLKNNIRSLLTDYSDSDLSVAERDGKLYVSLSQNLLFKSGSDRMDNSGKRAVQQLAQVLIANPDIEVTVEGHTDSDGNELQNWKLSTNRAIAVIQVLRDSGIDPTRLTASGRSYFDPSLTK